MRGGQYRLRIFRIFLDHAAELHRWRRDLFSVNRSGGARVNRACRWFEFVLGGRRNRREGDSEHPAKENLSC